MSVFLAKRMEFALEVANYAGKSTLSHFPIGLESSWKEAKSPVTEADCVAENTIWDLISATYPQDGIVDEAFEDVQSRSGCSWIIAPIDGTKAFIHGVVLRAFFWLSRSGQASRWAW